MGRNVVVISHVVEVKASMRNALEKAGAKAGGVIEGHAKEYCPVQSGNLQNSITYEVDTDGDIVTVVTGTDVYYAPYVELGHNQKPGRYVPVLKKRLVADHVAARPFLYPAVNNHLDEIEAVIESCF